MGDDEEPSMREQLIEARAKIVKQLDDLKLPPNAAGRLPFMPDYRSVRAELEAKLREIDVLLNARTDGNS
ncbi:MAG TPA: hypothetical protein VLM18_01400 [Croceibacterium sp.]|nr:hypothetical protein [Croceibacterium sp.]